MDFLYKKHPKGTYEYANYRKRIDIIVMVVMFLLALGLYVIGRVATGTNRNLLTIVAVLGLLPASKMVVDVTMCLRVHPCSEDLKKRIDASVGALDGYYNLYFTSYNKNYPVAHMVIYGNSLIGVCTNAAFDEKAYKEHMSDLIRKEGIKDTLIKIFTDEDKYIARLKELNGSVDNENATDKNDSRSRNTAATLRRLVLNVTL